MKKLSMAIVVGILSSIGVSASDDHGLLSACKAECPSAKTEDEAHKCLEGVVKNKKSDKKFRKSDCFEAFREAEKHDKDHKH